MQSISAPWRMEYIRSEKPESCVLCVNDDACKAMVLKRGQHAFVMMNRYPYSSGHLMVVPIRHIGSMEGLTAEEKLEIFEYVALSVKVLKEAMSPEGFNIGMNLGQAAGAGVDDHLHVHIVPRWNGDTNFMSVVGDVRVIPEDVEKTWEKLLTHFNQTGGEE